MDGQARILRFPVLALLFVASVHGSHITLSSPTNSSACYPCSSTNVFVCNSSLPDSPMINWYGKYADPNCYDGADWNLLNPQLVQTLDSAYSWGALTVVPTDQNNNVDNVCGNGYFLFGYSLPCKKKVPFGVPTKLLCRRPLNLPIKWATTTPIVVPYNPWGTGDGTISCPNSTYMVGFRIGDSESYADANVLCAAPADAVCADPPDRNTVFSTAPECSPVHQHCVVNVTCKPNFQPVNGSQFAECRPSATNGDYNVSTLQCVGLDICSTNTSYCGNNSICTNQAGVPVCSCQRGYQMVSGSCQDVNECSTQCLAGEPDPIAQQCNNCTDVCNNTVGGFVCSAGVNACLLQCNDTVTSACNNCSSMSQCTPGVQGAFTCSCPAGYSTPNGGQTCVDIDECATSSPCAFASCQNLNGSYACNCFVGYNQTNSTAACTPINECANPLACPSASQCVDTTPSYYCLPLIIDVQKDNTSAPFTLSSTEQLPGDVVSITVLKESNCVRSNTVYYGVANRYTSSCAQVDENATTATLQCTMSPGAGANLSFSLQYCPNSTFPTTQPCQFITAPNFAFSYPAPTLITPSLTFNGSTDPIGIARISVAFPDTVVTMQGTNFSPSETTVFFGKNSRLLAYTCSIVSINFTSLSCLPQVVGGSKYTFTVIVGTGASKQYAFGIDQLSFLGDPPVLSGIDGCTVDGEGAKDCPTEGGVQLDLLALTSAGNNLTAPQLFIEGSLCPQYGPLGVEGFSCILPPGVGNSVTVELRDGTLSWFGAVLSYAGPTILSISSPSCNNVSDLTLVNCAVPLVLFIKGSNFGASGAMVTVGTTSLPATHLSSFPLDSPSGPNGEHRFLMVNVTSLSLRVNAITVTQRNGGTSEPSASLAIPACLQGEGRSNDTCALCPSGRVAVAELCMDCLEGMFQNQSGQTACTQCPEGFFQNNSGQSFCVACDVGTYPNAAHSSCDFCLPGKFNPAAQSSGCLDCPQGTFQPLAGAMECFACPAGTYSTTTAIVCGDCPPGRVTQSNQSASCSACPPGTEQRLAGKTSCDDCSQGFVNPFPSSFCLGCSPGKYQNITRATACALCEIGFAQGAWKATSCSSCMPGYYSGSFHATSCEVCGEGQFSNVSGASACWSCQVGSAQKSRGSTACVACDPGSFADVPAMANCAMCLAGSFQASHGASQCELCGPGHFAALDASTSCTRCLAGTIQPGEGQQGCVKCAPGQFQSSTGTTSCIFCPSGYAAIEAGASSCAICPSGTFSTGASEICLPCPFDSVQGLEGQASCKACGAAASPNEVATKCQCDKGFFALEDGAGNITCESCPMGAEPCSQRDFAELSTRKGYWRSSANSSAFHRCHIPGLCLGGDKCQPFRTGPLCELCMAGYRSSNADGPCSACPATRAAAWGTTAAIILFLLVLLVACYALALGVANAQQARIRTLVKLRDQLAMEHLQAMLRVDDGHFEQLRLEMHGITPSDIDPESESESMNPFEQRDLAFRRLKHTTIGASRRAPNVMFQLKIMIGFFQIAAYMPSQDDILWPTAFAEFIRAFSVFNFDFIPWQTLGCVAPFTYFEKAVIVGFIPVMAIAVLVVFFIIGTYLSDYSSVTDQLAKAQRRAGYRRQFVRLVLFTIFLVYPLVSKSTLGLFNCLTVDGVSYLVADFTLYCFDRTWNKYAIIGGVLTFLYPFGIPVAYLVILFRRRRKLRDPKAILSLGFLYEAYSDENWYWEIVDMVHKLVLTSCVVFSPSSQRMAWNMGILCVYLIALLLKKPYIRKGDDRFHQQVQVTLFSLAFVGFILDVDQPYDSTLGAPEVVEGLVASLLIIIVVLLICSFLAIAGKNVYKIFKARKAAKKLGVAQETTFANPFSDPSQGTVQKEPQKEREQTTLVK